MSEINQTPSSDIVISSQTDNLVEREMANETADIKKETKALVEAIKKRAQSEIQTAQNLTREGYLTAVRQAREAIEQNQLIDPERIEQSVQLVQQEAQKNWQSVTEEIHSLGDRLSGAAKAAWSALTQPKS